MDVLGIDLAKLTFDVTLLTTTGQQHYHSFPNTPAGFTQLQAWLQAHGLTQLHACMEATNIYWEALATVLHAQGHIVSVVTRLASKATPSRPCSATRPTSSIAP